MSTPERKEKRYVSLRIKIWIAFVLIFTPVFIASYIWFYLYTSSKVLDNISSNLADTVEGSISGMNIDHFVQLVESERANNPLCMPTDGEEEAGYYPFDNELYMEHVVWLDTIEKLNPNARLYTYVKGDDAGEVLGIGSSGALWDEPAGFMFCQSYISEGTSIYGGLTQRVDVWEPYEDPFGEWITTYAPIVDENGTIVGAVGVDILASYVREVQTGIVRNGVFAFIVSYLLVFGLVYLMSGIVTRPLIMLADFAGEIADGNYDQDLDSMRGGERWLDELDTLTNTFKIMIKKVAEREKTLRKRVKQLEIIVDNTKRESEVQQIVESDFFQDLQSKVKDMRKRFHDGDEGSQEQTE
jgi:HAMP domain-containing protein